MEQLDRGAAAALGLLRQACALHNGMATFAEAGIAALIAGALCVVWTVHFERNLRDADVAGSPSE